MSEKLKQIREEMGLTRAQVAALLDISERHLLRLETGKSPLKEMHVRALCDVYGISPDVIRKAAK